MAKPKLLLIPSAQGSKFYSVLPSSGVGDFDFSRSGGATRINSQGLIETVADGVSRLNYPLIDGKVVGCPSHLLEPQSTNLITYSEDFSQSYWLKTNTSIPANKIISPDGTLNGAKLNENTVSNTNFRLRSGAAATTGTNTLSIFAKAGERNWIKLRENAQTGVYAFFNLQDGTIGQSTADDVFMEYYGNGWYKLSITDVLTSVAIDVRIAIADGVDTYNGVIGNGLYVWGAMIEQGSYPTSYIKSNNGSATTRSAETANNSGDASTFNDSEGVLMAEISALDDDLTNRRITISDNTTNNRIVLGFADTSNTILALVGSNGTQFISTISISDTKLNNKFALKYKQNDFALWVNGIEIATGTSGNTPLNLNNLKIQGSTGFSNFYGNTKQLQYFDSALNDSELEKLTSWVSFEDMANGQQYSIK